MPKNLRGYRAGQPPRPGLPARKEPLNNCVVCGFKAGFGREMAKAVAEGKAASDFSGHMFGITPSEDGRNILTLFMVNEGKLVGMVSVPVGYLPSYMAELFAAIDSNEGARMELAKAVASADAAERLEAITAEDVAEDVVDEDEIQEILAAMAVENA